MPILVLYQLYGSYSRHVWPRSRYSCTSYYTTFTTRRDGIVKVTCIKLWKLVGMVYQCHTSRLDNGVYVYHAGQAVFCAVVFFKVMIEFHFFRANIFGWFDSGRLKQPNDWVTWPCIVLDSRPRDVTHAFCLVIWTVFRCIWPINVYAFGCLLFWVQYCFLMGFQ